MGNSNPQKETRNKAVREWIRSIGTFTAGLGILIGLLTLWFTKEKEASDRLLNIITLLDNKNCKTVRAGAASTMEVYLDDYKQYQDRAFSVMASNLATEDDPLVRCTILNILRKAEAEAIEPLIFNNRILFESEIAKGKYETSGKEDLLEAITLGQFPHGKLHDISIAMAAILRKSSTKEFKKLDLSKMFLASPTAEYIDLKNVKLEGVDLNHAILCRVDLTDAILQGANLEDASLVAAILKNAELGSAILAKANLASANLCKAKLVNADLCNAILVDANMAGAILDEANIYGADLTNAILARAHLTGANMTGAHLEGANLKKAILENANLSGADFSMTDLRGAYLTDANLAAAILQGADLEGAKIEGANLENANLKAKVLFSIDCNDFQYDLNKGGTVSADLQQEFISNGFYLSQNATLSVEKTDQKWLINDKDNQKEYTIRKENWLNVCKETKFKLTDIKKAKNWDTDKVILEDDVKQKLFSHQN